MYCRPVLLSDGLWDQIRVDCGREFALILFIQELLSSYRTNVLREPYLQTRSTQVIIFAIFSVRTFSSFILRIPSLTGESIAACLWKETL